MPTISLAAKALSEHPFLSSIPLASLRRLGTHVHARTYGAGEEIFRQGGPADRFFLIRSGLVRLEIDIPGVEGPVRTELEILGPDAALGWSWLFSSSGWQLSAIAMRETSTLVFDAGVLRALMAAEPVLGYELMRRFAAVIFGRLQATRRQLTTGDATPMPDVCLDVWAGQRTTVHSGI